MFWLLIKEADAERWQESSKIKSRIASPALVFFFGGQFR
jgi:hypothetical protein